MAQQEWAVCLPHQDTGPGLSPARWVKDQVLLQLQLRSETGLGTQDAAAWPKKEKNNNKKNNKNKNNE